ncbi:mucus-binding protein precursor, LPXTG-motif cell wall anchor [Secundilactobacillus silagincola]|uniref:Mucus-binding protein, LPXTG-motif cell wall anchor n=1 Tax=Secundilactobacillus silagincola TaxID=1714681 RepID=A0A1Z5J2N3_9LACO|nr:KxYKxGKxW signal peptide domain-containing protein [Secundilactobacillus silagincola]GAX07981.1 mucus-binding protein precursor, LPXTG-motif cell wall anchor [Secundilactobacillus silagincola]
MEKYKFNRNKLQRDTAERKVRYKLYKAGTRWLVAGMATLTFGISAFALPQEVKADTTATDGSDSNVATIDQSVTAPKQVTLHNTSTATSTPATTQTQQGTAVKSTSADSTAQATTTQGTATPTTDSKAAAQTATKAATADSSKTAASTATDTKTAAPTAAKAAATDTKAAAPTTETDAAQAPTTDSTKTVDANAQQSATDTKTDASAKSADADIQKTDLGSADLAQVDAAKKAAAAEFAKTGKAQVITASDPTNPDGTDTTATGTNPATTDTTSTIPATIFPDGTSVGDQIGLTPKEGTATYDAASNTVDVELADGYSLTQDQVNKLKAYADWTDDDSSNPDTLKNDKNIVGNNSTVTLNYDTSAGGNISSIITAQWTNPLIFQNSLSTADGGMQMMISRAAQTNSSDGSSLTMFPNAEVWVYNQRHVDATWAVAMVPSTDIDSGTGSDYSQHILLSGKTSDYVSKDSGSVTSQPGYYHMTDSERDKLYSILSYAKANNQTVYFSGVDPTTHETTQFWIPVDADNKLNSIVNVSIVDQAGHLLANKKVDASLTVTPDTPGGAITKAVTPFTIDNSDAKTWLSNLESGQSVTSDIPGSDGKPVSTTKNTKGTKYTYTGVSVGAPSGANEYVVDTPLDINSLYPNSDVVADSDGKVTGHLDYDAASKLPMLDVTYTVNDPTLNAGEVSYVDVTKAFDGGKTSGFAPSDITKDSTGKTTNVLTTDPVPIGTKVGDPISYTNEDTVLKDYPNYVVVQQDLPSGNFTQDQLDNHNVDGYVYLVKKTAFDTTDPSDAKHQSTRTFTFTGDGSDLLNQTKNTLTQTLYWVKQTTNTVATDGSGKVTPSNTWLAFDSAANAKTYMDDMTDTNPDNDADAAKLLADGYGDSGTFAIPENHQATATDAAGQGVVLSASKATDTPVNASVAASAVTVDGSVDVKDLAGKANQTVTITLSVTKSAGAEIHYIDVSNSKKTSDFVPNDGNQVATVPLDGKTDDLITTDGAKLYDYAKDGYVAVQKADFTGKKYDATTPAEFYTYLRKTNTTYTPDNPGDTDQTSRNALTKVVTEYVTYGDPVGDGTKEELKDYDLYRTVTVSYTDGKPEATITYSPWTTNVNGAAKVGTDGNVSDRTDTINVAKLTTNELQKQPGYTESFANTATGATLTDDQKAANVDVPLKIAKDADNSPIEIDRAVTYAPEKETATVHYVYQQVGGTEVLPSVTISGDAGDNYTSQLTIPATTPGKAVDGTTKLDDANGTLDTSTLYYYATADPNGGLYDTMPDKSGSDTQYSTDGQDIWIIYTAKPGLNAGNTVDGTPVTVKRTIHYVKDEVQSDGTTKSVTVAPDAVQTLTLTPKVIKDDQDNVLKTVSYAVTGSSEDGKGTADTDVKKIFTSLASPTVAGYTPDNAMVDDQNVPLDVEGNPQDLETTVTYAPSAGDIQSLTVPGTDANTGATTNTIYFYKGPKVTDTNKDGKVDNTDIPDGDTISSVVVTNGVDGSAGNMTAETDPNDPNKIDFYYVGKDNSKTPAGSVDIPKNGNTITAERSATTDKPGVSGIKVTILDSNNKAVGDPIYVYDASATPVHSVTVDDAAKGTHTTYFYTGDVPTTHKDGTPVNDDKPLTDADIPDGAEIGKITANDGSTPDIKVDPNGTDNKDGTTTYKVTIDGTKDGGSITVKNGKDAPQIFSFNVDTPATTDTPASHTTYFYTGTKIPDPAQGTQLTQADIEKNQDTEVGHVTVDDPLVGTQDNHDGTFTLTVNGQPSGSAVKMPAGKTPVFEAGKHVDKDNPDNKTGNGYTPIFIYADGNKDNGAAGNKTEVDIPDAPAGNMPKLDLKDDGGGQFELTVNGAGTGTKITMPTKSPTIHSVTVDDTKTGTHTTYFYTGDVPTKHADGSDVTADSPATYEDVQNAKNPIIGDVETKDGAAGQTPKVETITNPNDPTKKVYSFYLTGPNGEHNSIGTVEEPTPEAIHSFTVTTPGDATKGTPAQHTTYFYTGDELTPAKGETALTATDIPAGAKVGEVTVSDGVSPQIETIQDPNNPNDPTKKVYSFYVTGPNGDHQSVGTIPIPKDGITPTITTAPKMSKDGKTVIGTTVSVDTHTVDKDGKEITKDFVVLNAPTITQTDIKDDPSDANKVTGEKITITSYAEDGTPTSKDFTIKNGTDGSSNTNGDPSIKEEGGNLILYIPAGKDADGNDVPEHDLGTVPMPGAGDTITADRVKETDVQGVGGVKITVTHATGDPTITYLYDGENGKDGKTPSVKPGTEDGKPVLTFFIPADGDTPEQDLGNIPAPKDGDTITTSSVDGDADHPNGGTLITIKHGDGSADTTQTIWNGKDGATPTVDAGKDNGDGTTTYQLTVDGKPTGSFTVKNGKDGTNGQTPRVKYGQDINGNKTLVYFVPGPKGDGTDDKVISEIPAPKDGDTITATPVDADADHPNGGTLLTIKHGDGTPDTTQTIWNGKDGATPVVDPKGVDNGDGTTTYNMTVNGQPAGSFTVKNGVDGKNGTPLSVKSGTDKDGKPALVFYVPGPKGDGTDDTDVSTLPVPNTGDTITSERVTKTDEPGVSGVKVTVTHANGDPDTISYIYDGATPTVTSSQDGKSYTISFGGKDVATITNGKDGVTPVVTVTPNKDGDKTISNTLTISTPGSDQPAQTVTITNGADGKPGSVITTKPIIDPDTKKQTGVTLVIDGKDSGTVMNGDRGPQGEAGKTPTITPTTDKDGNPTGFIITGDDGKPVTVTNGKDGATPNFVKTDNGYDIMLNNTKVGEVNNGKDGATPMVTTKPAYGKDKDINGDPIRIGTTLVINGMDEDTILNGTDGISPVFTPVKDDKGNVTGYNITLGDKTVGTVTNGKDGSTPQFTEVKDGDKVTGYTITIGDKTVGTVTNGKDGSVVTTKPLMSADGKSQVGLTLVIDGKDSGTILNGAKGDTGAQGPQGDSPVITADVDGSGKPTGTYTIKIGDKTVGQLKDGSTPQFNPVKDTDGNVTGYDILVDNNKVGSITNGKDGATPVITQTPTTDADGKVTGTTITITTPGSKDVQTINVTNGKDGSTPVLTPEKDDAGNVTGYSITINGTPAGELKNGTDGSTVTTKPALDANGKQIGVTLVIDGKDGDTILNGKDGASPVLTPVTDKDGNVTSYTITIDGKPAGSLNNPKDGSTPIFNETKDDQGNVTGYDIVVDGKTVGSIKNGVDGKTPVITTTPELATDGKTVIGTTITITTPGSDDKQVVEVANGKDGQTPTVKEVTNPDGTKSLVFYVKGPKGDGTDDIPVGTIDAPKDGTNGQTPSVEPIKDSNTDKTIGYNFYYTNDKGEKVSVGKVDAPKDGETPTVKPHNGTDGKQDGYTFTLNGVDYTVLNGEKGDKGDKGDPGSSPVLTPVTDKDGNTSYNITLDGKPVGTITNGKNGTTPEFTEIKDKEGKVTGYTITEDGKTVGTITNGTNGKDGVTPVITTTPELATDGKTVIGTTITITTPGSTDAPQKINIENGKDGQTPTVKPVLDKDGNAVSYQFYVPGPKGDGTDDQIVGTVPAPKNGVDGKDGKDGQTPQVKPVKDNDGNVTSYEFFIPGPKGDGTDDKIVGTVPAPKNGKDGETPTVKPHTGDDGKTDGFTYTLNGVDYTVLNGKDGAALTIKSQIPDKDGNTVVTFSDGSTITVYKGKDGTNGTNGTDGKDAPTPQVRAVKGEDGTNSYEFYVVNPDGSTKTIGTVTAPKDGINGTNGKDGQTPQVKEVTNPDGTKSFEFYITNPDGSTTDMGNVPAPKDGETPKVTPHTDAGGNVDGYTFTIDGHDYLVKNGKDLTVKGYTTDKDGNTVVTFSDGSTVTVDKGAKGDKGDKGDQGEAGETPQVKAVVGQDGKTSYVFYTTDQNGKETDLGTVDAPKDGKDAQTPSVKEVTNEDGSKSYEFYITNPDGSVKTVGTTPAPKDGETPTVKPHTGTDGKVDGYTFTIGDHDYTVTNGQDGKDISVKSTDTDAKGNIVVTFSDDSTVTIPKGTDGKDAPTPEVKAVPNADGTTSYEFYITNPDGSTKTIGTVAAPKDGKDAQTPSVKEVTNNDGSKSYEFYITNPDGSVKTVGTVPAPKDGETPKVTETKDTDGNVDGYIFTIDGKDYTVKNGKDGKDGKDGQTPQVKTVTNPDGSTSYEFYITNPDGSTKDLGNVPAPKDGQTPQVKEITNSDGSKSYEFYITNPDGSEKNMGTVDGPKDITVTSTTKDPDGNTVVEFSDGNKVTIDKGKDGKDGQTPEVKAVVGQDGVTHYEFYVTNPDGSTKTVGNVTAPKDGKDGETPSVQPVKDADGNTVSYEFYYTNDKGQKVLLGTVDAPKNGTDGKDGETPAVAPYYDANGVVDGWTFTLDGHNYIVKNGQDGKDGKDGKDISVESYAPDADGNTVITFSDGSKVTVDKGKDGKDGQTPQVKAVKNDDGTTSYEFYVTDESGKETTVGTVKAPKDGVNGKTPNVEPVKDADGNTVAYNFYYTNDAGEKVSVGTVDAPKDGATPTIKPHYDADGNVDGWTLVLNGTNYVIKDGKNGVDGKDGKDGQTPQIDPSKTIVNKEAGTTTYYFTYPDGSNAGSIVVPNDGGTTNGSGTGKETDNGTGTSTGTGNGSGVNITNTNNQNNGSGTGAGTDNGQGTNSSTTTNTTTTNSTTTEKTVTTNLDGSTTETDKTTTTGPNGQKVVKIVTIETTPNPDGSTTTKTTTTTTAYPAPSGDNGGKTTGDNNTGSTTTPTGGGNSNVNTNTNTNTNPGGNGGTDTNTNTNPGGNGGTDTNTTTPGGNGGTNTNTTTPGGNGGTNTNTTTPGGNGGTNTNTTTPGGNGGTTTNTTNPGGNGGTTTQTTTSTITGTAVPGGNTGNGNGTGTSTGTDGDTGTSTGVDGGTGVTTTPGGDNGLVTEAGGATATDTEGGMVPTSEAGNGGASTIHEAVAGGTAVDATNGNGVTTGNGKAAAQGTLPQTNETSTSALVMLGVGMTIMEATLAYGITRRKRHDSDDNDHESLY